jgi:phosphonate metabolism-associated iron-containing alcohol dehydrogenase
MERFRYHAPTEIRFGAGLLDELGRHLRRAQRVCVVTGLKSAEASGLKARIEKLLHDAGVVYVVFGAASPNPPCTEVDGIAKRARDMKCQLVIGVGGGSAMDAAKGVAVGATNPKPVADLVGTDWPYRALPLLLIPTTAGTGSEVNQYAILTDEGIDDKVNLNGPDTYPYLALLDPELTVGLPLEYTVDTGVDAFCHAVEGYISRRATPLSDALALEAIARTRHALPKVCTKPDDVAARGEMLYAACVAGLVIAQAGTTMVHALGYHLTLKHGVSHGRANAALIAHGLDLNYEAAPDKIGRVYEIFGGSRDRRGVEALEAWLHELGVATELAHYGVAADELASYAAYVMTKGNTKSSPRVVETKDVETFLKNIL